MIFLKLSTSYLYKRSEILPSAAITGLMMLNVGPLINVAMTVGHRHEKHTEKIENITQPSSKTKRRVIHRSEAKGAHPT